MPPSAMTGTPVSAERRATTSGRRVSCGTPTPATMRVVQIEPGPMPTLTPSAPASNELARGLGRRDVAGDHVDRVALLELAHGLDHVGSSARGPCRRRGRRRRPRPGPRQRSKSCTPTAAPTRRRPRSSVAELGKASSMSMSFIVIRPAEASLRVDDDQLLDLVLVAGAGAPPRATSPAARSRGSRAS